MIRYAQKLAKCVCVWRQVRSCFTDVPWLLWDGWMDVVRKAAAVSIGRLARCDGASGSSHSCVSLPLSLSSCLTHLFSPLSISLHHRIKRCTFFPFCFNFPKCIQKTEVMLWNDVCCKTGLL